MSGYHDPFSKSALLNRMHTDLELSGKMKRTQEAYLRAIRKLSEFLNLMPDVAVEDDLLRYILFAKTINPGALALSTSPTTASSSSTASLALAIGKPSVRFASSTNANYPRSSPPAKLKSFFASSTSRPQATELGQPRNLDSHSSSLLRDSLARSGCQSQGHPKVSRAQES